MYKLIRRNVERVVDDAYTRDKLLKQGYKLVVKPKEEHSEDGTQKDVREAEGLSELTVDELKKLAKEKGIEGLSKMKKDELINALQGGE